MNGVIGGRRIAGWLSALALSLAGCNTLETVSGSCSTCGEQTHPRQCNTAAPCDHQERGLLDGGLVDGKCGHSIKDWWANFDKEQLHPNKCWPEQFSRESKRRVYAPFGQQLMNGNAIELTVWQHYFKDEKDHEFELNEAGEARLQYLARKKPFVIPNLRLQTSFNPELDQRRIQSVVDYAKKVSFEPQPWNVVVVNEVPTGIFGMEAPRSVLNMTGPLGGTPRYESQIKQTFMAGQ